MKAWIENNAVRDVANGDPAELFHPAIAALYDTEVPAGTLSGATQVGGAWVNPVPAVPPPPPTRGPVTVEEVQLAVQERLDAFARSRNYDGILSACTYASSSVERFRDEGAYCVDARDTTWSACYAILAAVEAGSRLAPTSVEQVLGELPGLAWPGGA